MYAKIHKDKESTVVAVCDEDLIGKTLTEGDAELVVSEHFFKGKLLEKEAVIRLLQAAENVNLIGEEAVACGCDAGLIDKETIVRIGGVPHAQFYNL